ncbi:MAG: SDR family NAD(P)-dependent oxidoreductase [Candidatus Competibacteraceae bacterium]
MWFSHVASSVGLCGSAGLVSYCTSKFGVVGFGESLAQEVDRYGIQVYTVCPGRVATDMQQEVSGRKVGMPPEKVAGKILQLPGSKPPIASGKYRVVYE